MKANATVVAQRLLNLYRQAHVIVGGWAAVNHVFITEAQPDVIEALRTMPTGKMLIAHIQNLRSGKTAMNTIEHNLLPYGGMMEQSPLATPLSESEIHELKTALNSFTPDQDGLNNIMRLGIVKKFGNEWINAIRAALTAYPDMLQVWNTVSQTYTAYSLWNNANQLLNEPISERTRAQLQADMPEYETYLPMFGQSGVDLLTKLRTFISTRDPISTDNAPDAPQSI